MKRLSYFMLISSLSISGALIISVSAPHAQQARWDKTSRDGPPGAWNSAAPGTWNAIYMDNCITDTSVCRVRSSSPLHSGDSCSCGNQLGKIIN
jgi:hypothetical protein